MVDFFSLAPVTAVDAQTGLLSREGFTCEVAVALAARKPRALLMFQFGAGDGRAASIAAQALHAEEPLLPVGRIETTAGILIDSKSDVTRGMETVRRAGVSPRAVGFMDLAGPSTEAGARVDAALGALARIAAAGGTESAVDLARYALTLVPMGELVQFARDVRAAGGGMGLLLLDELEHYGSMEETFRAAIELELREQLGASLQATDRIAWAGPGGLAVATRQPVDRLLRDVATAWRARGPLTVGALELDRGLRVFVVDEKTAMQLVTDRNAFLQELVAGTNAQGLPTPMAHWFDRAHRAGTQTERAQALVRTMEATWRLLGCILMAAFWSTRKGDALGPIPSVWPSWRGVATKAAEALRCEQGRIGELAAAIDQASIPETGSLSMASEKALALSSMLTRPSRDDRALEQATTGLEVSILDVFAALRSLRGWSLVAVRHAEPLDALGAAWNVDYADFTGPHALGVQRRHTICGLRVLPFVYLVRWTEGLAIPLEPLIRRIPAAGTQGDGLAIVENIPTASGLHAYAPVSWEGRIELQVTARQLTR